MTPLLKRLWAGITWPFRMVAAFFRGIGNGLRQIKAFFTEVPEEVSLTETVGEALSGKEGFWGIIAGLGEHIDAMRIHLLRAVIALAITTAISFLFAQTFMEWLARPLGSLTQLQVIEPTESIGVYMRVSLLAGLALAMPWIVMEIYLFVAPGLMPRSRVALLLAIPAVSILFILGLAFTYFVMLPAAIQFLYSFGSFKAAWRPSAYFGLVTSLMFWVGVSFQMPMVIYAVASVGLLRAKQLVAQWKVALVVITIIAAMITPTVDPVNQALVMAPMIALYGLSIVGAAVAERARGRSLAERAAG
ncbi:MAG: twin-arginine translocase subunit TatC [Anaerolineales bacterium]|nr:twin-arginine translocase subunit TatC [Anaerolineales bacterium]